MEKKKYTTLEELEDKYVGEAGTPEREQYEFELSMEILGEKLKKMRLERNLTQEQLGKLIGVQKAQISKLENGASSATVATILSICATARPAIARISPAARRPSLRSRTWRPKRPTPRHWR